MSGSMMEGARSAVANVRALEFWKDTKTNADGTVREVHWVRWAKIGDLHYNSQEIEVSRLMGEIKDQNGGDSYQNPVWAAIRPHYEAWLSGTQVATGEMPLDAWPALGKRELKALRDAQYRSVEEIAAITDGDLGRLRVPNPRRLRDAARAYVENKKGSAHIEQALASRDADIEELKRQLQELTVSNSEMAQALKAAGTKAAA